MAVVFSVPLLFKEELGVVKISLGQHLTNPTAEHELPANSFGHVKEATAWPLCP